MADPTKDLQLSGGSVVSDVKNLFSVLKTRRTRAFVYGFMFAFVAFTVFLAFSPSSNSSSPWFLNIFSTSTTTASPDSYRSQFSSIFSYFFPNNSYSQQNNAASQQFFRNFTSVLPLNASTSSYNNAVPAPPPAPPPAPSVNKNASFVNNRTQSMKNDEENNALKGNQTANLSVQQGVSRNSSSGEGAKVYSKKDVNWSAEKGSSGNSSSSGNHGIDLKKDLVSHNTTVQLPSVNKEASSEKNLTLTPVSSANQIVSLPGKSGEIIPGKVDNEEAKKASVSSYTAPPSKNQSNGASSRVSAETKMDNLVKSLMTCNLFDGKWVRDDSYPLYKPGSCTLIDEQFNCIRNGRPDNDYQKMKWKPNGCTLPRMSGSHMLELIRGKRLVFVGDSLNRNMWESLICILKNSLKNKRNVYEANGRVHFRGEASYSFVFKDYNCTVEFFVSPFLVREWEMPDKDGTKKETLRLDLVGRSCDMYKDADFIIFNTGHWWTHEKTSKGENYYQEGSHVYGELNVLEAFRKALTTWARWVDANVNPAKSMVFFRGYSASHFSGGQWNSGGACDSETEPIKNDTYLTPYPPKMMVLESVLKGMKTHVTYLNITRLTDYRKDGHPSMYRLRKVPEVQKREPLKYQDCSHWCLPGVPDAWNELLYAEILVRQYQKQQQQQQ